MTQVAVGGDGCARAEPARPLPLRQVGGAEHLVDHRQAEVLVACPVVDRVVPVVPLGRVDHPSQTGEPQPHVGVLEQRQQGDEHRDAAEHAGAVAEQHEGEHRERLGERLVERVETTRGHPVHLLDAVVHRVEAPQERHLVREPVAPVVRHRHHRRGQPDRRPCGEGSHQVHAAHPDERDGRGDHQHEHRDGREHAVHQDVGEVGQQRRAERPLAAQREELLQRDEQHEEEGDPEHGGAPGRDREEERDDEGESGQVAAHPTSPHRQREEGALRV